MANSLQDNVLVHFENPDPANPVWQIKVASGILDHANNRVNEYGLSYSSVHRFVQGALTAVGEIMDVTDPAGGYTPEVLKIAQDAMDDFVQASSLDDGGLDDPRLAKNGIQKSQSSLGLRQVDNDLRLVDAARDLAIEKIAIAKSKGITPGEAAFNQGNGLEGRGPANQPSGHGFEGR